MEHAGDGSMTFLSHHNTYLGCNDNANLYASSAVGDDHKWQIVLLSPPSLPPPAYPLPHSSPSDELLETWRERCCSATGSRRLSELQQAPWAAMKAAMEASNRAFFRDHPEVARMYYEARESRRLAAEVEGIPMAADPYDLIAEDSEDTLDTLSI